MPNPHLTATGQPWKPSTYGYSGPAQPVATGTPNFGGQGTGGANQPPIVNTPIVNTGGQDTGGRPWSEDEIVGPPIVDTTPDPVVDSEQVKVDYQAKQREQKRLEDIQKLKSLYASTMSSPGPLGGANLEGLDLAKIFESFGDDPTIDPDDPSYNYGNMPSGDQIPVTDWDKLNFLHHLGLGGTNVTGKEGLGSLFAVDSSGNAILDSSGNLIKTGLGDVMSDQFNEIVYGTPSTFNPEDQLSMEEQFEMLEDEYGRSFDQDWYGMDDFDYDYYGGGPQETASLKDPKYWAQDVMPTTPTSFADLQRIYGKEFGEERIAAPHAWGIDPFSEIITEIT